MPSSSLVDDYPAPPTAAHPSASQSSGVQCAAGLGRSRMVFSKLLAPVGTGCAWSSKSAGTPGSRPFRRRNIDPDFVELRLNQKHQITRAAEYQSLATLRDFIEATCKGYPGVDDQVLYDLKLAVDEACTNIITHGYAGMNPGSIILAIDLSPQQVTMTITDFGQAFEPTETPMPDVEAGW